MHNAYYIFLFILQMNVDVHEYQLNEITVEIISSRRVIAITASHKSQCECFSAYREFTLPAGAPHSDSNVINAVLSANGILKISGPCSSQVTSTDLPVITDSTNDAINKTVKQQQQNTLIDQQNNCFVQQNTSVKQNTNVKQLKDTAVRQQQCEQQVVQKRYTKITRETFSSSTMTSLDITDATDAGIEPLSSNYDQVEDVTEDMCEDEDGNLITVLDIIDYRAEEITVKASKTAITVVGRKDDNVNRQFVKTIRVPSDVVVSPDTVRSILDKSKGVLTIIITQKETVNTTKKRTTENTTEICEEDTQQRQQKLVQQKQEKTHEDEQRFQLNTANAITKRTLKTITTTIESLKKLGYNFDSATSQVYSGDPTFFERETPILDYKPEELEVKIAMPWIIIEGKQEMSAENGWRSKQFTKMFTVPEGVKQQNIHLEMNDAGDIVKCTARID